MFGLYIYYIIWIVHTVQIVSSIMQLICDESHSIFERFLYRVISLNGHMLEIGHHATLVQANTHTGTLSHTHTHTHTHTHVGD